MKKINLIFSVFFIVIIGNISFSFKKQINKNYHNLYGMKNSGGITGRSQSGCTCHGGPSGSVTLNITGIPANPIAGVTYPLQATLTGSNPFMGFNISAPNAVLSTNSSSVQMQVIGGELTHTSPLALSSGSRTIFFNWQPTSPGSRSIFMAGNNTNGSGTSGDFWTTTSVTANVAPGLSTNITNFKLNQINNTNILSWQNDETGAVKSYELQQSENGLLFTSVSVVNVKNSNGLQNYSAQHENSLGKDLIYYRLKTNAVDGREIYSQIITARKNNRKQDVVLYPNPVSLADRKINLVDDYKNISGIEILNITGMVIARYSNNQIGNGSILLPNNITTGSYFIKINYLNGTKSTVQFNVK